MFACEVEVGTTKKRKRSGESVNETLIISDAGCQFVIFEEFHIQDAGCRIPYIPGFSLIFEEFHIRDSTF